MRLLIIVLAWFIAGPTLANAHAFLDSSEPAVGSTVKGSPAVVQIWFTRQLAKGGSNIAVFSENGTEVDRKDFKVDPGNTFLMTVSVGPLSPGRYKVIWNAICLDSHHTTGTFAFNVAGP